MKQKEIVKLGLFGTPGAGKSTTCQMVVNYCLVNNITVLRIKLADPLYEAQSLIYGVAGLKLEDFYQQDGELLNFLGYYLRKLNPKVLLDKFSLKLASFIEDLSSPEINSGLIICDDLRQPDAKFLKKKGFTLIKIVANPDLCERRRSARGDKSLGSSTHLTEQGLDEIQPDYSLENNESLMALQEKVRMLLGDILNDTNWHRNTA